MIKAIIFDCFGVLVTDGWLPFKRQHFGHDQDLINQAGDLNKQVNAGLIDYEDFLNQLAGMAELAPGQVRRLIENNPPNTELFDYIQKNLKPHYKIGMLSNAADDWLSELFTPDQVGLFDAVALSYETKVIKPDEKAYQIMAERLGVELEACIFIDDQPVFCRAAEGVGMKAIVYTSVEQVKKDLSKLINVS